MQIHQLPAITTVPDSYMIPCDSGSANYYVTAKNLLQFTSLQEFPNTQAITVTANDLTLGKVHNGFIQSTEYKSTCGVPEDASYFVEIRAYTTNTAAIILISTSGKRWVKMKVSGTWQANWTLDAGYISLTPTKGSYVSSGGNCYVSGNVGIYTVSAQVSSTTTITDSNPIATIPGINVATTIRCLFSYASDVFTFKASNSGDNVVISPIGGITYSVTSGNYIMGQVVMPITKIVT